METEPILEAFSESCNRFRVPQPRRCAVIDLMGIHEYPF